jgi:hypothetical protein
MNRFFYILIALAIIILVFIVSMAFGRDAGTTQIYMYLGMFFVLGPWIFYGIKLKESEDKIIRTKRQAELEHESNWQGKSLLVKHRWFVALISGLTAACVFFLVTIWAISILSLEVWTAKGVFGFLFLMCIWIYAGLIAWTFCADALIAIANSYSVKVNEQGIHFVGLPLLSFESVSRVGYREDSHRGVNFKYLIVELNNAKPIDFYEHWLRNILVGYVGIGLAGIFQRNKPHPLVQIYAGAWKTPASTIAAAIRHISHRTPNPVFEYDKFMSINESQLAYEAIKQFEESLAALKSAPIGLSGKAKSLQSSKQIDPKEESEIEQSMNALEQKFQKNSEAISNLEKLRSVKMHRYTADFGDQIKSADKFMKVVGVLAAGALLVLLVWKIFT